MMCSMNFQSVRSFSNGMYKVSNICSQSHKFKAAVGRLHVSVGQQSNENMGILYLYKQTDLSHKNL